MGIRNPRQKAGREQGLSKNGVVYTPQWAAELIFDNLLRFRSWDVDARVLDPACGDGAFLTVALNSAIEYAGSQGFDSIQTADFVRSSIVGRDIDSSALADCSSRLTSIAAGHGIAISDWDLRDSDSLLGGDQAFDRGSKFSHIVGNPPYIRIQDLPELTRRELQGRYSFCGSGSTDIFFAFFERCLELLDTEGVLSFITSRSLLDSAAGKSFRSFVVGEKRLLHLLDFGDSQVFEDATTYTMVTTLAGSERDELTVPIVKWDAAARAEEWKSELRLGGFTSGQRWNVVKREDSEFLESMKRRGPLLSDFVSIRVGLATLRDKVYVVQLNPSEWSDEKEQHLSVKVLGGETRLIERDALRRVSKVSKVKADDDEQGLAIIFPYEKVGGRHVPWSEESQERFPLALEYLGAHRKTLDERGHPTRAWFEYGSTQGLDTLFAPKILVPSMTRDGTLYLCNRGDWTLFSGYALFFDGDLIKLHHRLKGDDFRRFAQLMGRTLRGGWFSMTTSSLGGFSMPWEDWAAVGAGSKLGSEQLDLFDSL